MILIARVLILFMMFQAGRRFALDEVGWLIPLLGACALDAFVEWVWKRRRWSPRPEQGD